MATTQYGPHASAGTYAPGSGPADFADQQFQQTGFVPEGYEVVDGHVQRKQPSFFERNPWLVPLIVGGGATAGAEFAGLGAAPGAGSAVAGGGAAADTAGSVLPSTTIGTGMIPGIAGGTGVAGAAGGGSSILGGASHLLGLDSPQGILGTAGRIGGALSGIEADRQAGRQAEANATTAQDRNAITAAAVNLGAPTARLSSSVKGDIAANAKDFSYGAPTMVGNLPVPTSTGGLRPSIFSQATRQLGALNSQEALANETADGGKVAGVTPLPQATTTDSILGNAGNILSLVGAIPYKAPKPTQPIFYTGGR